MGILVGSILGLLAPLALVCGFTIWDHAYTGHPYFLNLFKSACVAVPLLLTTLLLVPAARSDAASVWPPSIDDEPRIAWYLLVSGFIGITVGDCAWLVSMQSLGARRVILVDSVKPFVGALLAYFILDEALRWTMALGMAVTLAGVIVVSLERADDAGGSDNDDDESNGVDDAVDDGVGGEREALCDSDNHDDDDDDEHADVENGAVANSDDSRRNERTEVAGNSIVQSEHQRLMRGYRWSVLNVALDVYASVLTKQWASSLSPFEISTMRFGSAGASLAIIYFGARVYFRRRKVDTSDAAPVDASETICSTGHSKDTAADKDATVNDDVVKKTGNAAEVALTASSGDNDAFFTPALASFPRMQRKQWILVAIGSVITTFLGPILMNAALFELDVGTYMTFMALAPVYALPVVYVVKRERASLRAIVGALIAVGGVAILYNA
jgi:drug/metabolite transporter (DMT)-like permease